ncbi:hypothetical protein VD0002_g10221 [Verticillium dahliae]|nr:hypothetical protein VD0004_g5263 [Verticillium dahliae]PNH51753.1 hypothetical protein VD0002_g10221 [Verticillium dahliae]
MLQAQALAVSAALLSRCSAASKAPRCRRWCLGQSDSARSVSGRATTVGQTNPRHDELPGPAPASSAHLQPTTRA